MRMRVHRGAQLLAQQRAAAPAPTGRRPRPPRCAAPAAPSSRAMRAMCRAAARGLAAPKLLTMRMPCARQRASTGRSMRVEQRLVAGLGIGAAAQLGQRQRALGQGLEDQEGALPGGPRASRAISVSTTGPAASVRSPEKPAAQPISRGAGQSKVVHGSVSRRCAAECRPLCFIRKIESSDRFIRTIRITMSITRPLHAPAARLSRRWPSSATSRAPRRPATCRSRPSAR